MIDCSWLNAFVRASGGERYEANNTYRFPNAREVPQEASLRDVFDAAFDIRRENGKGDV